MAAVVVGLFVSYALGAAVLLLGAAVALLLARRGSGSHRVELFYDLDEEAEARFSEVRAACEALAGSEKVWRVDEKGEAAEGDVVPVGARHPVSTGLLATPGFSANVEVWGIEDDATKLFFLPECVLSYKDGRYRPVSYNSFGVVYARSHRWEGGEVPGDAEVVETAGRLVETNGVRRRPREFGHPVVAYGLLTITGAAEGQAMRLLVSNKARAVRFARPFGLGKEEAQKKDAQTAREARARRNAEAENEKNGAFFKILGLEPGASQAEIHAAYKKKAMMYHPDRVASLGPEVREMAEIRMKEINAAYGEIKRKGSPGGAR